MIVKFLQKLLLLNLIKSLLRRYSVSSLDLGLASEQEITGDAVADSMFKLSISDGSEA